MTIVLSIVLILTVAAVFKYKRKISELNATIDALELEILEINYRWEKELNVYQLSIDNLKLTQCKNECKESEPVVVKVRKPKK
jgi:hypothetical protein